jgi:hypothetical protein
MDDFHPDGLALVCIGFLFPAVLHNVTILSTSMALQVHVGIATLASCQKFGGHAIGIFLIAVICIVTGFATLEAHSIEC